RGRRAHHPHLQPPPPGGGAHRRRRRDHLQRPPHQGGHRRGAARHRHLARADDRQRHPRRRPARRGRHRDPPGRRRDRRRDRGSAPHRRRRDAGRRAGPRAASARRGPRAALLLPHRGPEPQPRRGRGGSRRGARPTDDPGVGSRPGRGGPVIGAIRSEVRKFFSTRMWWGMAIAIVVVSAIFAALFRWVSTSEWAGAQQQIGDPSEIANSVYTGGLSTVYLLTLAVGVLQIGSEYRHKTITNPFLATPRRGRVMVANVISLLG